MARITGKFYKNGVDNQKRADIILDLIRPDSKDVSKWTPEQKEKAKDFLLHIKEHFESFYKECSRLLNME